MSFEKEINAVLPAVARACGLCVEARKSALCGKYEKPDGTPVTAPDYAVQFAITKAIRKRFPKDEIVAEESPGFVKDSGREGILAEILKLLPGTGESELLETLGHGCGDAKAERFWTVDPVDGTAGFISGNQFAVAVALIEDKLPSLGFLGCPGLGFILFASPRNGVRRTRIDGSDERDAGALRPRRKKAVFCETARGSREAYLVSGRIRDGLGVETETVRMDSQCKYALVACGEADVFLRVPNAGGRRENVWDHSAGEAIVRSGGGTVSDFDANPLDFSAGAKLGRNRGIVASGPEIYGDVMDAIKKAGL